MTFGAPFPWWVFFFISLPGRGASGIGKAGRGMFFVVVILVGGWFSSWGVRLGLT